MTALSAPATLRNREPILAVLRRHLAEGARVLEIAAGTGEHAVYFAQGMPSLRWRATDPDPRARESIAAWRDLAAVTNLQAPVALDAADPATWPADPVDAVVCINMIHIAPWTATQGLLAGADRLLTPGGKLILYGPFLEADVPTAPSNAAFDADLRRRDPAWGIRDLGEVSALAAKHGLSLAERIVMPANNLMVVFEKA